MNTPEKPKNGGIIPNLIFIAVMVAALCLVTRFGVGLYNGTLSAQAAFEWIDRGICLALGFFSVVVVGLIVFTIIPKSPQKKEP